MTAPVALVSGSLGGIGRTVIRALQRDGMTVAGLDVASGVSGADLDLVADITDLAQAERAVSEVHDQFGQLDVLVNGAGINLRQPFRELDLARAREVFEVNVWGTVHLTRAAEGLLHESRAASVVVLTSIGGELGITGGSAYGMSKAALGALVRVLAVEWAQAPIRVNAVSPAIVPTAMNEAVRSDPEYLQRKLDGIPIGRMIEPEEVAEAVAFLAGAASSGITGDVLHLDGGAVIQG